MPDTITAAEQDAIAAFFASGGKVTKLPPCCAKLDGAVPREMLTGEWTAPKKTPQQRWSDEANAAKARKAADGAKREAATEERRRTALAGKALLAQRAREAKLARLSRIIRHIGGQWTTERIKSAAELDGTSTKVLRAFLRANDHGDKLPAQVFYTKKGTRSGPPSKADAAKVVSLRANGAKIGEIIAACGIGESQIRRILREAGFKASTKHNPGSPPTPERDKAVADFYLAGWTTRQCEDAFGLGDAAIRGALRRQGVKARPTSTRTDNHGLTPPDMRGAA